MERSNRLEIMAKERKTIKTLYRKMWPLIWLAKTWGLLPWTITGENLTLVGIYGRVHSMTAFGFCTFLFVNSMRKVVNADLVYDAAPLSLELCYVCSELSTMMHLYHEIVDPHAGIGVIESLRQYDRKVELLGHGRADRVATFWVFAMPLIFFISLVVKTAILNGFGDPYEEVAVIFTVVAFEIGVLKFCIMANLLGQRYKHLNESVVPIGMASGNENSSGRPAVTIHDVVRLHATLARVTLTLATKYSSELLIWCAVSVNTLLQHIHLTIQLGKFTSHSGDISSVLLMLVAICWTCHRTACEANKLGYMLLKMTGAFRRSFNFALALDTAMYAHNHRVVFTAGNLCDVNLSTILKLAQITLSFALIAFK